MPHQHREIRPRSGRLRTRACLSHHGAAPAPSLAAPPAPVGRPRARRRRVRSGYGRRGGDVPHGRPRCSHPRLRLAVGAPERPVLRRASWTSARSACRRPGSEPPASRASWYAVLDTGIDATHPEFAGASVPGFDALDGVADSSGGLRPDQRRRRSRHPRLRHRGGIGQQCAGHRRDRAERVDHAGQDPRRGRIGRLQGHGGGHALGDRPGAQDHHDRAWWDARPGRCGERPAGLRGRLRRRCRGRGGIGQRRHGGVDHTRATSPTSSASARRPATAPA